VEAQVVAGDGNPTGLIVNAMLEGLCLTTYDVA
jgi:hypothetical protein